MAQQNEALKRAREALDRALEEKRRNKAEDDRRLLIETIGENLQESLRPLIKDVRDVVEHSIITRGEIRKGFSDIKIEVPEIPPINVQVPEIKMPGVIVPEIIIPEIKIPDIKVPEAKVTVNVPPIKIPEIIMPDEMNVKGWVSLMGVDLNNPLPVQLRDSKGNPINLFDNLTQVVSGGAGGGGGFKNITIGNVTSSAWGGLLNADNRLRMSIETGGTGLTDTELRASSILVSQVSGAAWSVSVNDIFRTTAASNLINADDRLRVSLETGGSGLTDTELRASAVPVSQVSGSVWSVISVANSGVDIGDVDILSIAAGDNNIGNVDIVTIPTVEVKQVSGAIDSVSVIGTATVSATDLDIRDLVNATDSVSAYQVSGASWSVNTGTVTVTATDLDVRDLVNASDSVSAYQVSGAIWSVSVNDAFRTTVASNLINADDRLRVSLETGGSGLTDSELRASSVPVAQASGAIYSTNVAQLGGVAISLNAGDADTGTLRQISAKSSSATTTSVSVGADASTSIVPTNLSRKSIILTHASTSNLFVATGSASSTGSLPVVANQIVGFDDYTGPINAIAQEQAGTISVRYIEII